MNYQSKSQKFFIRGFSLVELLVVISIIGILTAVVLASLNVAKTKGQDADVQQQLSQMRSRAELYYGSHRNTGYGTSDSCDATPGMFTDTESSGNGLAELVTGVRSSFPAGADSIHCHSNPTNWIVFSKLLSPGNFWCVDSVGNSKSETTDIGSAVDDGTTIVCP